MQFLTSKPGVPYQSLKSFLHEGTREVLIFAPFIRSDVLSDVLPTGLEKISVVTRMSAKDIQTGASDLDVFSVCETAGAKMFANNHIHLKAYVRDWTEIMFGSSNLTRRGLGHVPNFNLELNAREKDISPVVSVYLKSIINKSKLVTVDVYNKFLTSLEDLPEYIPPPEPSFIELAPEDKYLVSSLPMSRSIEELYSAYSNNYAVDDQEVMQCALHDVARFDIPLNLQFDEFRRHLEIQFFQAPFVRDLLEFIDQKERYFGEVKAWIQENCHDVPVPSRRDLTGNIQVLYHWIVELSNGQYRIDRPRYSERIFNAERL